MSTTSTIDLSDFPDFSDDYTDNCPRNKYSDDSSECSSSSCSSDDESRKTLVDNDDIKLTYDNKEECMNAKKKISRSRPDGPIFVVRSKEDVIQYLYPKIDEFHNKRKLKIDGGKLKKTKSKRLIKVNNKKTNGERLTNGGKSTKSNKTNGGESNKTNGEISTKSNGGELSESNNAQSNTQNIFENYKNILFPNSFPKKNNIRNKQSTIDTIDYMLNHFNTSVFVQILNNKLVTFVLLKNEKVDPEIFNHITNYDKTKYKDLDHLLDDFRKTFFRNLLIKKAHEDSI